MATQIFVNLPVRDLERSKDFFGKLGYTYDPHYTDENAACMVVDENIFVMLLTVPFFQGFTTRAVANAQDTTEVITALSCDSREQVDEMVKLAVQAGATTPRESQDYGFMYQHGFADLDGHLWEYVWMNPEGVGEAVAGHKEEPAHG
jgi:predicted lactoylglutathione lyase